MPWQRLVADVALELDENGKLVYREVILTVPRQSGKTTLLLVLVLLRALAAPRQNIAYTAQTGSDARKKWMNDWLPDLESSEFARLFRTRKTNGHEALLFKNGSIQGLIATTKKSGHGGTLDLGILDEAFAHPDARLEQAIKPAMITRPQPQLWIVSTAGTPEMSPYLLDKVEKGRMLAEGGVTESVAYFEWSADEEANPADPATWRSCMPALGHTTPEEAVAADFESMELNEFERAYLNRWKSSTTDSVIPLESWLNLKDEDSAIDGRVWLGFDVTPDRSSAAIAAAGFRSDGIRHVEVVEHAPGVGWVPNRLAELIVEHNVAAVICDGAGPAASLLPKLAELEIDVTVIKTTDHARACGDLFDLVAEKQLRHLGSPEMTMAVDGAIKRYVGDVWLWNRKSSSIDISPLVACTLALSGTHNETAGEGVWDLNEIVERMWKEGRGPKPPWL